MSNETARFYDKTKSEKFSAMMQPPEPARGFGPDAWVYSEIRARLMVIEAYERGLREGNSAEQGQN